MFRGYIMLGVCCDDEDDRYNDKEIIGISDTEPSMEAIGKQLEKYDRVLTQFWYTDTLIAVKTYTEVGSELTFSLSNQLHQEIEEAKGIIVKNTKILNELGLL